jgi:hypothetical protein
MRFKVPQFIDIEDKLFGNLTLRQFIYLIGGGGLAYLSFRFLPGVIALVIGPACAFFGIALAFYKVNDKPFIFLLESMFKYFTKPRIYLWKKKEEIKVDPFKAFEERGTLK